MGRGEGERYQPKKKGGGGAATIFKKAGVFGNGGCAYVSACMQMEGVSHYYFFRGGYILN